jgi:hypothetical protein
MTIKQTAAELRRTFKGHTVALVAPVRTYDDDTWSVMVFSGHPDQPRHDRRRPAADRRDDGRGDPRPSPR